jgi:hypothetical protein
MASISFFLSLSLFLLSLYLSLSLLLSLSPSFSLSLSLSLHGINDNVTGQLFSSLSLPLQFCQRESMKKEEEH